MAVEDAWAPVTTRVPIVPDRLGGPRLPAVPVVVRLDLGQPHGWPPDEVDGAVPGGPRAVVGA